MKHKEYLSKQLIFGLLLVGTSYLYFLKDFHHIFDREHKQMLRSIRKYGGGIGFLLCFCIKLSEIKESQVSLI